MPYQEEKSHFTQLKASYFIITLMFSLSLGTAYRFQLLGREYNFQFAEAILIIGIIIIAMRTLVRGSIILYSNDAVLFSWIFLVIWVITILFWAGDPLQHIGITIAIVEGLLTYIIAINLFYPALYSFQIAVRLFTISLVTQLIINMWPILMNINNSSLYFYEVKKYAITAMGNSNYIALYLEFALLYELIRKSKHYFIFAIVTTVGLVLTLSRSGLLVTLAMICLIVMIEIRKLKFKRIFLTLLFLLCIGSIFFIFMSPFVDILKSSMKYLTESHSLLSREELWENAWDSFSKFPFLGQGLHWKGDPHNTFLRALSNLGIIGTIPFLTLLLIPIRKLIHFILLNKNYLFISEAFASLLGYLAIFIHSLVEPMFLAASSQIWLGLFLAYVTILTNQHSIESG